MTILYYLLSSVLTCIQFLELSEASDMYFISGIIIVRISDMNSIHEIPRSIRLVPPIMIAIYWVLSPYFRSITALKYLLWNDIQRNEFDVWINLLSSILLSNLISHFAFFFINRKAMAKSNFLLIHACHATYIIIIFNAHRILVWSLPWYSISKSYYQKYCLR